jgi:IclR helix-turn-helix domain
MFRCRVPAPAAGQRWRERSGRSSPRRRCRAYAARRRSADSPAPVFSREPQDQLAQLAADRRSPRTPVRVRPAAGYQPAMPTQKPMGCINTIPLQMATFAERGRVCARHTRMTAAEIAETLGMPLSTVSGILARLGLGRLGRRGHEPAVRYEGSPPGWSRQFGRRKLALRPNSVRLGPQPRAL